MRAAIGLVGGLAGGLAGLLMLAACGSGEAPSGVTESETAPAVEPVSEPAAAPATGPASEPATGPAAEPEADVEPAADPAPAERTAPEAPAATEPSTQPAVGDKIPDAASEPEAAAGDGPVIVDGYRELAWEELMPEGEEERLAEMYQQQMMELYSKPGGIAEGSTSDVAVQLGTFNAVKELDGEKIRLPGYTVPFSYDANQKVSEFLLVPYFGACIHAPPPPPNQTVLVRMGEPIGLRDLAQAVWIEGTLKVEISETDLADAAYVIEADKMEIYEY